MEPVVLIMKNKVTRQIKKHNNSHQSIHPLNKEKSPIAKCIATALFIMGSTSMMVAPVLAETSADQYTYENITIGSEDDEPILDNDETINNAKVTKDERDSSGGLLTLGDSSKATNTLVDGGSLDVVDEGEIKYTSIVNNGYVSLQNEAKAYETSVKNSSLYVNNQAEVYLTRVYNGGFLYLKSIGSQARNTFIHKGGTLKISPGATISDTTIFQGGNIITTSDGNQHYIEPITMKNTDISGHLELSHNIIFEGETQFLPGAEFEAEHIGIIQIINKGNLIFSNDKDMLITAGIDGDGGLELASKARVVLFGRPGSDNSNNESDYSYRGRTLLSNGLLVLDSANFFNSPIIGNAKTELWVDNGSYLRTTVQDTKVYINDNSQWDMTGDSSIDSLSLSSAGGRINLNLNHNDSNNSGNTLTIYRDYTANFNLPGTNDNDNFTLLTFNTQLGNDDSPTDRMIVNGNTSGMTNVRINNTGGVGGKTDLGILLIKVLGRSEGEFKQVGRIVAGAYEYKLGRGKDGLKQKNWYLTSDIANYNPPAEGINQQIPLAPADNTGAKDPEKITASNPVKQEVPNTELVKTKTAVQGEIKQKVYRPENGSYIANIAMARNLFSTRLEKRSGSYQYKDAISGQLHTSSMWMHTQGGKNQFGNAVDQLNTKGKYYSVQLGTDIIQKDSWRVGVLAGVGKATNHSQSKVTRYYSHGSIDGYNLGLYATWLSEQEYNTGFYLDTLAQYSWFNNSVNGQEQVEDKYKSSGFTTSIESGYTFKIADTNQFRYFIQPNAQMTLHGIKTQTHKTPNGDFVSDDNRDHIVMRFGAKAYLQTTSHQDSQFTPFIAINLIHQNRNTSATLSGDRVENKSKSITEFKIGMESKIEKQLYVWAAIDHQLGRYSDKSTNVLAGIKYHF
ncbi:autotransporter outer membrane beta-barrel domain-containing protein [Yersinia enterocolitica]|uniref:autotransporter family protein n=1 Tax=Yersinia enterocolitica TaxID=630 RepID=UPI003F498AEF